MEYTDDGDSKSELLGPVQEQQLEDTWNSEPDEPLRELPPLAYQGMQQPDTRGRYYTSSYTSNLAACCASISILLWQES